MQHINEADCSTAKNRITIHCLTANCSLFWQARCDNCSLSKCVVVSRSASMETRTNDEENGNNKNKQKNEEAIKGHYSTRAMY